jgi:hypothetical protein
MLKTWLMCLIMCLILISTLGQAQYGPYRLKVSLYDDPGQPIENPNYVFYDTQFRDENYFINLNDYDFADKTAGILIEKGPNYRNGDYIMLYDAVDTNEGSIPLSPGPYYFYDLNDYGWADRAAGLAFRLQ